MPAIDTQAIAKRHKDKLQYAIAYLKRNPDADVKEIKDAIYENFGHDIVKRSYEIHCIAQMAIDQMKNLPLFSDLEDGTKMEILIILAFVVGFIVGSLTQQRVMLKRFENKLKNYHIRKKE